jgi:hypothetical protein
MSQAKPFSVPNPLKDRAPELLQQLTDFRARIYDMLLDQLAALTLRDPAFRAHACPHSLDDVKAVTQVLRVLTKSSWDADDLKIFDACWRQASFSDLFADECEAERHRIQHCMVAARKALVPSRRAAGLWK